MRIIDGVALCGALLAIFSFLASSGQFRVGRWVAGLVSLTFGAILFTAGLAAGAVSVGTEGYRGFDPDGPTVVANVSVELMAGDSIRVRVTSPAGLTQTFRMTGTRLWVGARILHWKAATVLFGRQAEYELIELVGDFGDGRRLGTRLPLAAPKPVDMYDLAARFRPFEALVRTETDRVEIPLAAGAVYELRISPDGLTTEPIG